MSVTWRSRNREIGAYCRFAGREQTQPQCFGWTDCLLAFQLFIKLSVFGMTMSRRMTIASSVVVEEVKDFNYTHLWASHDGQTHLAGCSMQNFTITPYAMLPQYIKSDFGGDPSQISFALLPKHFQQGLHHPPAVQFAVTLSGSWYVRTTDGSRIVFTPGDVLFQDNTKSSPAANPPKHASGTVSDVPCRQVLMQLTRPPEVDNPCPF